ncbi:MAG TPA: Hpt domain-containing protein, partial [Phenylobacterium sp.]|uniref:Hpt domain-containing protein n=1 Tax=Phenylobacterium sp. TaxID=1871053 RepID=UPI002D38F1B2
MDPLAAIRETFFQECEEQLAELESGLLAMEAGDTDPETINAVFRAVHSIKGGAGAFSLEALVRFAHVFETALDEMRSGRLAPTPDSLKVMLRAADVLADHVRAAHDDGGVDEAHTAALAEELKAMGPDGAAGGDHSESEEDWGDFEFKPMGVELPAAPAGFQVRFKPRADLYAKANEAALLLRELGRLGEIAVELDDSGLPALTDLDPEAAYLAWTVTVTGDADETAIREVFEFVDGDCELEVMPLTGEDASGDGIPSTDDISQDPGETLDIGALLARVQAVAEAPAPSSPPQASAGAPAPAAAATLAEQPSPPDGQGQPRKPEAGATIRVDLERVDRLIDLVGELVINQAMLSQRVMEAGFARASGVAMGLD